MHLNVNRALNEFFKNYIINVANEFENKFIKKKAFLIIERAE